MSAAFDPRIVRVGIELENDIVFFEGLDIRVFGEIFNGSTSSSCTIRISNLTTDKRNEILFKSSPIIGGTGRTPSRVLLDIGRESYGTFRLFDGTVYTSTVTMPPDIGITLVSLVNNIATSIIDTNSQAPLVQLEELCRSIATQNGLALEFNATPKMIANYSFTGAIGRQIEKLQMLGDIRCAVDNRTLIVMDKNGWRGNEKLLISMETGMVGVPQASESGVIVRVLAAPSYQIGKRVEVVSKINPSVNGKEYRIDKIAYEIASRDNPFYYTMRCTNLFLPSGTA